MAFLDSARALMLLLGIPFHASEIYRLSGGALITSPERSFAATLTGCAVHVFRMPAFFLLAGFFASMMLARRGARDWLLDRCLRLGIPLAFTTLAFGWLEVSIARAHRDGIGLLEAVSLTWHTSPLGWTHHRWFLFVLLLHCLTAVTLQRYVPANGALARAAVRGFDVTTRGTRGTLAFAALLVVLPFVIAGIGTLLGSHGLGIGLDGAAPYENYYLHFAIFFGYGYALHRIDGDFGRLMAFDAVDRVLAGLSIGVYVLTYDRFHVATGVPAASVQDVSLLLGRTGVGLLAGFYATRLFFLGAKRYLDIEGPIITRLVEGSLCIYLVHEVFVLALGAWFTGVRLPPMVELVLIVVVTLAASLGTFELVRRSRWLSVALDGRWPGRR